MGYYTRIYLSGVSDEVATRIGEVSGYGDVQGRYIKWYRRAADLCVVSLEFPEVLITVLGDGEGDFDWTDLWVEYYMNGKWQHYRIPPFKE